MVLKLAPVIDSTALCHCSWVGIQVLAFWKPNKDSFGVFTFQCNWIKELTHSSLSAILYANAEALTVMDIAFSLGSCLENLIFSLTWGFNNYCIKQIQKRTA